MNSENKILKFSLYFFLLFFLNIQLSAQTNDEGYIHLVKTRVHSILKDLSVTGILDLKQTENFRVLERYATGEPKVLRFDYIIGVKLTGNRWGKTSRYGSADVLFREGLPFAITLDAYKSTATQVFRHNSGRYDRYEQEDEITNFVNEDFTTSEKAKIEQFYSDFRKGILNNSTSYQEVLNKHKSYSREYNMKNNLAIVYKTEESYKIEMTNNSEFGNLPYQSPIDFGIVSGGTTEYKYYQNISNCKLPYTSARVV